MKYQLTYESTTPRLELQMETDAEKAIVSALKRDRDTCVHYKLQINMDNSVVIWQ